MCHRQAFGMSAVFVVLLFFVTAVVQAASTVTILAPSGGEVYVIGQKQFVRLADTTKFKSVVIELSRDGGTTFEALGTINNAVKDKSKMNVLPFTVGGTASSHCMVRATAAGPKSPVVAMSGEFCIAAASGGGASGVAGGDLTGSYPNPAIAAKAVTAAKVGSESASTNMVLAADGSGGASWITTGGAGASGVTAVNAGTGVSVTGTASSPTVNVVYGTAAGTAAQGNDARLSDARTPTAGSANYIQNQTASAQNAGFNISGNGTIGGNLNVGGTITANLLQIGGTPQLTVDSSGNTTITKLCVPTGAAATAGSSKIDTTGTTKVNTTAVRANSIILVSYAAAPPRGGFLYPTNISNNS